MTSPFTPRADPRGAATAAARATAPVATGRAGPGWRGRSAGRLAGWLAALCSLPALAQPGPALPLPPVAVAVASAPARMAASMPASVPSVPSVSTVPLTAATPAAADGATAGPAEPVTLLEVIVDGRATASVGRFVMRGGEPLASAADWRAWGVRGSGPPASDEAWVTAAALGGGARARVDGTTQTVFIEQPPDLGRVTLLGTRAGAGAGPADITPSEPGAVLNYDALLQRSAHSRQPAVNALLETRLFGAAGVLDHSMVGRSAPADPGVAAARRLLRLQTTWTLADPARAQRFRIGDFVGVGQSLAWTRPLRLLGAQVATDFSVRPDLVTTPSPQLAGVAAVPSTVDVLVNGVRQLSQPVEAGRFEVRQLPTVSGLGDVAVVVRDALGRETVETLAFYSAPRQLASGLNDYAVEAGRVRRRYGVASNDYGPLMAAATLRRGVSDRFTAEGHAEAGAGVRLAGAGGLVTVPGVGAFDAHLARSAATGRGDTAARPAPAGARTHGSLIGLGAERQGPRAGVGLQWSRASAGWRDLASTQGDPSPLRSLRLSGGFSLGRLGSLGAAWVQRDSPAVAATGAGSAGSAGSGSAAGAAAQAATPGAAAGHAPLQRLRLLTASYNVPVFEQAQLYVSAYRSRGSPGNAGSTAATRGVTVGLSIPFGDRAVGGLSQAGGGSGRSTSVQASRAALEPGDLGWRVRADTYPGQAPPSRAQAEVEGLSEHGRISLALEQAGGASAARLGLQGALVALGGRLYASRTVSDSVALVEVAAAAAPLGKAGKRADENGNAADISAHSRQSSQEPPDAAAGAAPAPVRTGLPGVAIYHQHRYVGRTDARGRLLVPGLLSFQANQLHVDPLDLPLQADLLRTATTVRPADRSGVVVRFGIERQRALLLLLTNAAGEPLPLGAAVVPQGGGTPAVVGYDGQAYLLDATPGQPLELRWRGRTLCRATLGAGATGATGISQPQPVVCL